MVCLWTFRWQMLVSHFITNWKDFWHSFGGWSHIHIRLTNMACCFMRCDCPAATTDAFAHYAQTQKESFIERSSNRGTDITNRRHWSVRAAYSMQRVSLISDGQPREFPGTMHFTVIEQRHLLTPFTVWENADTHATYFHAQLRHILHSPMDNYHIFISLYDVRTWT